MRLPQLRLLVAPAVVLGAVAVAVTLVAVSPTARARTGMGACPASSTCPTFAYLTLDVSAGGPSTIITVGGSLFLPGEQMSIYWDVPTKVIGSATASGSGSFANIHVKPFAGEAPGLHHICATVQYIASPCVQFQLEAATPSPSAQPSPLESSSPSGSPSAPGSATPARTAGSSNGLDLFLRPPLVYVSIIVVLGLLAAVAYWVLTTLPRRPGSLPSATIVHRSARPVWSPAPVDSPPPPPAQGTELEAEAPAEPEPESWPQAPAGQPPSPAAPDEPPDLPEATE
jgi:hypothetical protein